MKNKKLLLSVLSTAVVASMASSAFAAEAGIYIGGDVKHYYNISSFFEPTNSAKIVSEANSAKLKNVVFVDTTGKAATLDNILASGSAALTDDLEAVFGDSLHDAYVPVDKNGQEGTDPVVPEPSDSPSVDGLTQVVDGGKVTISGNAVNADSVEVTVFKASEKVATKSVDVADNKFSVDFSDLVAGDYTYEVVASNADEDSEVKSGSFKVEAPAELKVDSVSAINGIQLKVTYSKPVDRITAEDITKYTVTGLEGAKTVAAAQLLNDKEVLLTLNTGTVLVNGSEYTVKASKDIKDSSGTNLGADVETKTKFTDTAVPTVTEVKTLSTTQIKVNFSEPVKSSAGPIEAQFNLVELDKDGKETATTISASASTLADNGASVVLTLTGPLKPGTKYNFYTNTSNKIVDYAGYVSPATKQEVQYTADTTIPQASSLDLLGQEYVIVKFNKPINTFAANNVYWNVDGLESNNGNVGQSFERIDASTFKVKFNLISGGEKHFFVKGAVDYAGNVAPTAHFTKTVVDAITPAVTDIKLVDKQTIKVQLNEDVQDATTVFLDTASTADKTKGRAFYPITDKNGNAVLVKSVAYGKKADGVTDDYATRVITLYTDLPAGNNTVKVTGLKDSLGRVLTEKSVVLSVANMPTFVAGATASAASGTQTKDQILLNVEETTSTTVTDESLSNVANWIVSTPVGTRSFAEVAGAKITKVNDELYILEADKGAMSVTSSIQAVGLKTSDGKTVAPFAVTPVAAKALDLGNNDFVVATTLSKNQVTIKVNGLLSNVNAADFRLFENNTDVTATKVQSVTYANSTTKTANTSTITITMKEDLNLSNAYGLKVAASNIGSTDIFGKKFVANSGLILQDTTSAKFLNAYVSDATANANVITANFDKAIGTNVINPADVTVKKADGTKLNVASVITTGSTANITLAASNDIPEGQEVTVEFKKNLSSGKVADGSIATSSFRITGVSLDKGLTSGLIEGDESMTLTFNKPVNPDVIGSLVAGDSVVANNAITTALGVLNGATLFGTNPADTMTYKIVGNNVVITFTGLVTADTAATAPTGGLVFTPDVDALTNVSTRAIESVDGVPLIKALPVVSNLNAANLVEQQAVNVQFAPNSNTFSVSNNYKATPVIGDIDMDSVTPAAQSTITVNGLTYTATITNGVVTVAVTGTATATAVATTQTITVADADVVSATPATLTLNIPAVTAGDAASTVNVYFTN